MFLTSRVLKYRNTHRRPCPIEPFLLWDVPHVGPKTAVLCGELSSMRSRRSARPLRAARRPAVQHQPASLPPRRLLLLRAHARVLKPTQQPGLIVDT